MDNDYPDSPAQQQLGYGAEQAKVAYETNMVRAEGMHLQSLRTPKIRSIIEMQIKSIEAQLVERKKLLEDLDKLPEVETLLDRMRRIGV